MPRDASLISSNRIGEEDLVGVLFWVVERVRRLAAFWSWLPAFRAVGELEHLPSAAEELRVSPSALSRSVKQLEEHLGVELFERDGRRLVLNDAGRELLSAVRRAMRLLDDSLEVVTAEVFAGSIRIVAPGPFASIFVLPALADLRRAHPRLLPELVSMGPTEANAALLSGQIDLALLDAPIPEPELSIECLLDVGYGVYCGRDHPLFLVAAPTRDDILDHAFVAPPPPFDDHWPPDIPRKIGARVGQLQLGVELCDTGTCLAVLPDVVVARSKAHLRRLPFEDFAPVALFAVYREQLGNLNKTNIALRAVKRSISDTASTGNEHPTSKTG